MNFYKKCKYFFINPKNGKGKIYFFKIFLMASINIAWILIFLGIWKIIDFIILIIDSYIEHQNEEKEKKKFLFPFTK